MEDFYDWYSVGVNQNERMENVYYENGMLCAEAWTGEVNQRWDQRIHTKNPIIPLEPDTAYRLRFDVFGDAPVGLQSFPVVPAFKNDNGWNIGWNERRVWDGQKTSHSVDFVSDSSGNNARLYFWFGHNSYGEKAPHTLCIDNVQIVKK